jgi:hypothetical protein
VPCASQGSLTIFAHIYRKKEGRADMDKRRKNIEDRKEGRKEECGRNKERV